MRSRLSVKALSSQEFRAGAIWAAYQHFPKIVTTVDFAIIDYDRKRVLFAQKPRETAWRFPGGFSEPRTSSFEEDVKREAREETGLEIGEPVYVGSFNVDDWRYYGNVDKIRTLFYAVPYVFGAPIASDDISEISWVDFDDVLKEQVQIVPEHKNLLLALKGYLEKLASK